MTMLYNQLGMCLCTKIIAPKRFFERAKGLIGKRYINSTECYLFKNCNSVHMFFMKFSIDLIYVDKDLKVIKLVNNFKPGQVSFCLKAMHVIEMKSGSIERYQLLLNEKLYIKDV